MIFVARPVLRYVRITANEVMCPWGIGSSSSLQRGKRGVGSGGWDKELWREARGGEGTGREEARSLSSSSSHANGVVDTTFAVPYNSRIRNFVDMH